jgi:ketosteroid isomerase-like protein
MKKILVCFLCGTILLSCNNDKVKPSTTGTATADSTAKSTVDLPYTASYSSSWSTDVSDADLKMVLMTYKNWADGNISGLASAMADTVTVDMATGDHMKLPLAELTKFWGTYRDSLSSVKIDMAGWQKMYATDKKTGFIVTWYDETDTYKNGKVDSAAYHDINQVKEGKIVYYSTYKRPKK